MLQEISWKDYWTFIATATAVYWLIIISFFYRYELLMFAKRRNNSAGEDLTTVPENSNKILVSQQTLVFEESEITDANYMKEDFNEEELREINFTPDAHALATGIKDQIEAAQKKKSGREELLFSLQQLISTYSHLKATSFQNDINNLIISECDNRCSIHLTAEELKMLWAS